MVNIYESDVHSLMVLHRPSVLTPGTDLKVRVLDTSFYWRYCGVANICLASVGTFSQGVQTVVSGGVAVEGLDWAIKTKLGESVCR